MINPSICNLPETPTRTHHDQPPSGMAGSVGYNGGIMKPKWRGAVTAGLAALWLAPLGAQQIGSLTMQGSQRFPAAQIIAASGLHLGETVNAQVLAQAAQRLNATGAFASVQYAYQLQQGKVAVDFQLRDYPDFLPVEFDNFVWFSRAQLQAALKSLPLYGPELPDSDGSLTEGVQARLQALLRARGLPGRVGHIAETTQGQASMRMAFYVRGVHIAIARLTIPGAGPAFQRAIGITIGVMHFGSYSRSFLQLFAWKSLRPIFLAQGYLSVEFKPPQAQLLPGPGPRVVVRIPVRLGPQYRLGSLAVDGAIAQVPDHPLREIQQISHLRPGRILHYDKLMQAVQRVALDYASHGYFAARLQTAAQLHPLQAVVNYQIHIHPGPVYTMGRLVVEGWGRREDARIAGRWRLAQGAVFNQNYVNLFVLRLRLRQLTPQVHELTSGVGAQVNVVIRNQAIGTGLP